MLLQYPIPKPGRLNNVVDDIFQISPKEAPGYKHAFEEFPLAAITARKGIILYPNDHYLQNLKIQPERIDRPGSLYHLFRLSFKISASCL